MKTDNQTIEIPTSKKKTFLIILGCLMFVIICIWLWTRADNQTSYSPINLKIVSIVGIAFFGLGLVLGPKKLFDKRPGLIIDDKGIQINLSVFSGRFITWTNITKFEITQIKSTRIILIFIDNADEVIRNESKLNRIVMHFSMREYSTPFSIGSGTLKIDFDELYELLTEGLEIFKNK